MILTQQQIVVLTVLTSYNPLLQHIWFDLILKRLVPGFRKYDEDTEPFILLHRLLGNSTLIAHFIILCAIRKFDVALALEFLTFLCMELWVLFVRVVFAKEEFNQLISFLVGETGPFGRRLYKIWFLFAAASLKFEYLHLFGEGEVLFGLPIQCMCLVLVSILTNVMLHKWSEITQSRGTHKGLNNMVDDADLNERRDGRRMMLFFFAFMNALAEEGKYRGLYYNCLLESRLSPVFSNLLQSISFGLAHWKGVPSGVSGVLLAMLYGFVMCFLQQLSGGGLLIPWLCHGIADWFIFSVIITKIKLK